MPIPSRPAATPPPSRAEVIHSRVSRGGDKRREAELLLALSDERDLWLRQVLAAERDGYQRGERTGYDRGYVDGIETRKHAQHLLVDVIGVHLARWDGLRADFGKPRPGDFRGRQHG